MRQSVSLVDGDGVRDAVTRVEDDAGGATGSVERQNRLNGDVHGCEKKKNKVQQAKDASSGTFSIFSNVKFG